MTAKTIRAVYRWNLQEHTVPERKMLTDRGSARSAILVIMQMIFSRGLWYVSKSTAKASGSSTLIAHWNPTAPAPNPLGRSPARHIIVDGFVSRWGRYNFDIQKALWT